MGDVDESQWTDERNGGVVNSGNQSTYVCVFL